MPYFFFPFVFFAFGLIFPLAFFGVGFFLAFGFGGTEATTSGAWAGAGAGVGGEVGAGCGGVVELQGSSVAILSPYEKGPFLFIIFSMNTNDQSASFE